MRKPKLAIVPTLQLKDRHIVTQTRLYQVITPLFGGGVTPGETDPVTPIRGTEIRGHLRFWWRATRGGKKQFAGKLEKMKEFEDELWGAMANTVKKTGPSQVQIVVKMLDFGKPFVVRDRNGNIVDISHFRSLYSYAAFPLESRQTVTEGINFELSLSFPGEQQSEIEAALWAWETFGGIGARTRRGFGALRCVKIGDQDVPALPASRLEAHIKASLNQHIVEEDWIDNLPHLSRNIWFKVTGTSDDALIALQKLLNSLKSFRQKRNPGTAQNRPGRSKWPEPDAIRRITRRRSAQHSQILSQIDKFPRAEFGLPIIFQFKDENSGDPQQTTLQGKDFDRLASPLILRPILCVDHKAVGVALILDAPRIPPNGLILKGTSGNPGVSSKLTTTEAKTISPLQGQTDVLQAFLDTL